MVGAQRYGDESFLLIELLAFQLVNVSAFQHLTGRCANHWFDWFDATRDMFSVNWQKIHSSDQHVITRRQPKHISVDKVKMKSGRSATIKCSGSSRRFAPPTSAVIRW